MIHANNGPPAEPKVSQQLSQILNTANMNEKVVKNLLGVIILYKLLEGPTYGYDLIKFIHRNFNTFLSPSIVYPILYDLEKGGTIRSNWDGKKRIYTLREPSMAEKIVEKSVSAYMKVLTRVGNAGKNAMANSSM